MGILTDVDGIICEALYSGVRSQVHFEMAHVGIMTSGGNLCASQKIPKALRRQD